MNLLHLLPLLPSGKRQREDSSVAEESVDDHAVQLEKGDVQTECANNDGVRLQSAIVIPNDDIVFEKVQDDNVVNAVFKGYDDATQCRRRAA